MKLSPWSIACGVALVGAAGVATSNAATHVVQCTGVCDFMNVPDDGTAATCADGPLINAAISGAVAGDVIDLHGDCQTNSFVTINRDITLTTTQCASLTRNPVCFDNDPDPGEIEVACSAGSAIRIDGGANPLNDGSGATITGLTITAGATGVTNRTDVVALGCPATGAFLLLHSPDDITVTNNEIRAGGRGVQQYSSNGPPFDNVDVCGTAPPAPPVGYSENWLIADNVVSAGSIGLFTTGNDMTVRDNDVRAEALGIHSQNNKNVSFVDQCYGGAATQNQNPTVTGNVVFVQSMSDADGQPVGLTILGMAPPTQQTRPSTLCERGSNGTYLDNCVTSWDGGFLSNEDPNDPNSPLVQKGFSLGAIIQWMEGGTFSNNSIVTPVTLGVNVGPNVGIQNVGSNHWDILDNRVAGADFALFNTEGTEMDNEWRGNQLGRGPLGTGFAITDVTPSPSLNGYSDNRYCSLYDLYFQDPAADQGGNQPTNRLCGSPDALPGKAPRQPASACVPRSAQAACSAASATSAGIAPVRRAADKASSSAPAELAQGREAGGPKALPVVVDLESFLERYGYRPEVGILPDKAALREAIDAYFRSVPAESRGARTR